jgi:lincosamide nucleotidyltransferase A/C/D/E
MAIHTMPANTALRLLSALDGAGVDASVGGGWAVDALLGEQTREHSDLDLWVPAEAAHPLFTALGRCGVDRVFPWPGDRPWNFVLCDGGSLRVDLHFYEDLSDGRWHYGSAASGETFPNAALGGYGIIEGRPVRCEAAEWSVRWHTAYPLRDVDRHDIPLLCERFGIELPEVYATDLSPGEQR